ncbi:ABC transporter permease [Curtobacterium sp. MCBD17_034]|uniref:methionine ABC transporter permease n=1 Tax=unclassified Curtobacterium TaxID=257496 RepID=UPI000DAA57C7|nr:MULTISPECIES: methionine ABC transporter permease [unclassified Curtobacterium]PZF56215.1 ABC transporter permease [Curtobacterium sp. MCBD17_034]PZF57483.1 ABC transporter permease [Curtobacterium sp. MCBD17_013]PZM32879.1 ABC transporter permease [Curtobacterium sp. MCBD17_031]WIE53759.1 methionine ABC transporter permease [Curtobacterium sp. MCBD17_003]
MTTGLQGFLTTIDVYLSSIRDTLVMSLVSLVVAGVIGLALGLALYATRPGNLLGHRGVFTVLNVVVNIVRPIPFVIFLAAVAPLSRGVVDTTIGVPAVTFAISLAAAFAVARIVEQSLVSLDPGVVEAARSAGAHPLAIVLTVLIPEGLGPLVLGYTFIFVGIVDMTAQGALVGGGGLGEYAITYGSQRYDWWIVYISVATIVVIVQLGQFVGNRLARATLRR